MQNNSLIGIGVKSPKSWMSQKLQAEPHYLADIYERDQLESPLFPDGADCTELYINWINRFNCAVDGYIWLVERDVIDPMELVRQGSSDLIKNVLSLFQNTAKDFLKTQSHFLASYRLKCISVYSYTCTRFIYLFEIMLDSTSDMAIKNEIYQKLEHIFSDGYFTKELARTLLFPKQVYEEIQLSGTNSVTNSSINRTFTIAKKFITAIKKVGSEHIIRLMIKSIHDIIEASNLDLTNAGDMQGKTNVYLNKT
jgi:hypothetical protein